MKKDLSIIEESSEQNSSEQKTSIDENKTSIIEEFNNDFITQSFDGTLKISDSDIVEKHNIYSFDIISNFSLTKIYQLLKSSNMIVFIDENKIKFKTGFISCFGCCYNIMIEDNITIISDKFISSMKKILSKWNNYIYHNKIYKNRKLVDDSNNIIYNIVFDDNIINRKTLYYKMVIQDKIIFIPYKDMIKRKIEYKIRSFCQLMEEMGAKSINIEFDSMISKNNKISTESIINYNNMIAGSLGFNISNNSSEKNSKSYLMEYPENNNTILNKNEIEKNIKEGKFIINFDDYQSNLELQSIVNSRCSHFIHQYSTVFSVTNENNIDNNMEIFLNMNMIDFGQKFKIINEYFSQTIIKTNITFIDDDDVYNNINSKSISLDEIGFKYMMKSIQNIDFNKGIVVINSFIDSWIENKLKNLDGKNYYNIKKLMICLKKNINLEEYNNLLKNYFSKESQWLHFMNFFNVLMMNTLSYDKLGYIVAINMMDNNIELINYIIDFILSDDNDILKIIFPYDRNKHIFFNNKYLLIKEKFNEYNYNSLISLLKYYRTLELLDINDKDFLYKANRYLKNFNKNYIYQKFYFKFIRKYLYSQFYKTKNKDYINDDLFYFIKPNNFIDYNIIHYKTFSKMINIKIKKYNMISNFFSNKQILEKNTEIYIKNKLSSYYGTDDIKSINKILIKNYDDNFNIIKNILRTNTSIDFSKEISDYFTFNILRNNILYGYNIDNDILKFTNNFIYQVKKLINKNSYNYIIIENIEISEKNISELKTCSNFKDYIKKICDIINLDDNIIPKNIIDFITNV